jgi:hypothetical protein
MCYGTETIYIGAALAAAGAATSSYAQNQQLKSQDKIAAEGIIKQGQLQKQGQADVSTQIGSLAKSNAASLKTSNDQLAQYRAALQQGSGISSSASPGVGGSNKAYKTAQTAAGTSASDYVGKIADSAATTQGTQLERVGEGEQMGDTAGKLGLLSGQASEQNYLTKLKVQSTQENPWLSGLGMALSAAGGASGGWGAGIAAAGGAANAATKAKNNAAFSGTNFDGAGTAQSYNADPSNAGSFG